MTESRIIERKSSSDISTSSEEVHIKKSDEDSAEEENINDDKKKQLKEQLKKKPSHSSSDSTSSQGEENFDEEDENPDLITRVNEIFLNRFINTFAPDSYDIVSKKFYFPQKIFMMQEIFHDSTQSGQYSYKDEQYPKNEHYKSNNLRRNDNENTNIASQDWIAEQYRKHPLTIFSTFIGLPNQCDDDGKLTLKQLGKNFIGWQDGRNKRRWWINLVGILYAVPKNTLFMVLGFIRNLAKLFTEYFPGVIADLLKAVATAGFDYAEGEMNKIGQALSTELSTKEKTIRNHITLFLFPLVFKCIPYALLWAGSGLLSAGSLVFNLINFVGETITSPIDSVRHGLQSRHAIARYLNKKGVPVSLANFLGWAGAILLCLIKMTLTATFFALIPALGFSGAAAAGINLAPLANILAPVTNAGLSNIGALIGMYMPFVVTQLGALFSPAMIGALAVISGTIGLVAASPIGYYLNKAVEKCRNWWRTSGIDEGYSLLSEDDDEPVCGCCASLLAFIRSISANQQEIEMFENHDYPKHQEYTYQGYPMFQQGQGNPQATTRRTINYQSSDNPGYTGYGQ